MSMYGTSDIIDSVDTTQLDSGIPAQLLIFRDGKVLVLTSDALALHNSKAGFEDPLSSSLLGYAELADTEQLVWKNDTIISEYKSGYVGLADERAILISPYAIQLFPNKTQALYNKDCIAQILLED